MSHLKIIRKRSANGAFSMATTDIGAKARNVNQSYRKRIGVTKKEIKRHRKCKSQTPTEKKMY